MCFCLRKLPLPLHADEEMNGRGLIGCEIYIEINKVFCLTQKMKTEGKHPKKFKENFQLFTTQLYHDFHDATLDCITSKALHSLINKVVFNINCRLYAAYLVRGRGRGRERMSEGNSMKMNG